MINYIINYMSNYIQIYVSEKLDGSSVSVSSDGIIASRRCVMLNNPDPDLIRKTKFVGQTLEAVIPVQHSVLVLEKHFSDLIGLEIMVSYFLYLLSFDNN